MAHHHSYSEHPTKPRPAREPATAADVEQAVRLAVATLTQALDADWRAPAGGLAWDCGETLEHTADGLLAYATQLAPARRPVRPGPGPTVPRGPHGHRPLTHPPLVHRPHRTPRPQPPHLRTPAQRTAAVTAPTPATGYPAAVSASSQAR
ncbi:hypothetical protein GCM10010195_48280 [Kitasatospora griseola]|nr:hypothetical protein GCM10010195_48280 [Kitasatospora griseola]